MSRLMTNTYLEVKDLNLNLGPYGDLRLAQGCFVIPAIVAVLIVLAIGGFFILKLIVMATI